MSGPKVSNYELEKERQERLRREQRKREQEEMERRRIEMERQRRAEELEKQRISMLRSTLKNTRICLRRDAEELLRFVNEFDGRRFPAEIERYHAFLSDVKAIESYDTEFSSVCGQGRDKEQICSAVMKRLSTQADELKALCNKLKRMQSEEKRTEQHAAAEAYLREKHCNKATSDAPNEDELISSAEKEYERLERLLEKLASDAMDCQESVQKAYQKLAECRDHLTPDAVLRALHRFETDTLQHLAAESAQSKYRLEIRMKYESICAAAGVQPLDYSDSFANRMERACTQLQQVVDEHREKEYVIKSIEEAMEELGYDLLGHRTSGQQQSLQQYLYGIQGSDNVLRVTCDSTGQTVIEIGKGSAHAREAEEREKDALVQTMQHFCQHGFPEIQDKLRQKGVHLKNRMWLPPERDYAQIINVTPFTEMKVHKSLQYKFDEVVQRQVLAASID